ncbi:hypothetical protein [Sorangium sp. So ce176]|uniref:hypothetical protein n=1 Tax=Sorangium sp. So ce176 TaxID=3133286 RepID=UPI003F601959
MELAPRLVRPATLADLEALPPTWRGEILDDTLYAFPRPRAPHASHVEGRWMELGIHGADEKVRAAPFDAIEIDLAAWWDGIAPEMSAEP